MTSRSETALALLLAVLLALSWTLPLEAARSWGWDESMHAELPAARMLVALREGEVALAFDTLLDCAQYPFVYPVVLAAAQASFGLSEHVGRLTGTLVWCATLFGLFLLGRELVRERLGSDDRRARGARLVPWLALAFGALSPLALAYSGTFFLEVPFACAAVYALRAWLARSRRGDRGAERRRDLVAGAWVTVAFFTKFNYGVLLAAGLALDALVDAILAARAGTLARHARRLATTSVIPLAALAWWFLLPLPGGVDVARAHRIAFVEFLGGNTGLQATQWEVRVLFAAGFLVPTPRLFLLEIVAMLAAFSAFGDRAVRKLGLVFLTLVVAIESHPFHLDRFLVPCGVVLAPLAAFGLARMLPRGAVARAFVLALLAWATLAAPGRDTLALARRLGFLQEDPFKLAYQERVFASWHDLSGARELPTAGLERDAAEELLDRIAAEVGPDARVAWIGISSELSPAALHLGLLARGGSPLRFLRDSDAPMDVTYFNADPGWTDEQLAAFAARFDVVLVGEPVDLKDRAPRRFLGAYADRLVGVLGWQKREIARVGITRPLQDPLVVRVHACRRPNGS